MASMTVPRNRSSYRFASYNIRKARGTDGDRNPGRILDVINRLGADVVALQEADRRLGDRPAALPRGMIAAHSDFEVVDLATNEVSLGWHGNAVLVRKGLAVGGVSRITLPGVEPRGAVAVRLAEGPLVVGVHLGLLRSSRRRQLRKIINSLKDLPDTVVIGDMNEWSPRRGFEALEGKLTLHSPGRSFHASRPIAALDRAALGDALVFKDAGVEEGPLARRASDHLPIWVDVEMRADFTA